VVGAYWALHFDKRSCASYQGDNQPSEEGEKGNMQHKRRWNRTQSEANAESVLRQYSYNIIKKRRGPMGSQGEKGNIVLILFYCIVLYCNGWVCENRREEQEARTGSVLQI
jgi:hypothetical protein